MLQLRDTSDQGRNENQPSPNMTMHADSLDINDQPLVHNGLGRYDTYALFDPQEDERISRSSTAQSSRSQTPDNTDVDENAALLEQFEKMTVGSPPKNAVKTFPLPQKSYSHINDLPIDIMHEILRFINSPKDLLMFMLVQRRWFGLAVPRIWSKPLTPKKKIFDKFHSVMKLPLDEQAHPYAQHISRLNFAGVGKELTDRHFQSMARCTNLKRLVLARCCDVSPRAIEHVIRNTPNLLVLDVDEVPIDDAFITCLVRSCPDLQGFYGDSNTISDVGLAELARVGPSLHSVRLKGCKLVTPRGVLAFVLACPNLSELDVADLACFSCLWPSGFDYTRGFSDADIQRILLDCENLRSLKISSPRLTDSVLNLRGLKLLPKLANLRELHVSGSPLITDAGVRQITQTAPRLRLINLNRCYQITDRSLETIARSYGSNLEHLHIGHCMNVTDRGVIAITKYCHRLSFFDAANCTNLTDHSIMRLARLRKLKRIGIVKCMGITDQSVLAISENLPEVERLHLSYCATITQLSITHLLDRCRHIAHLSLSGVPAFMAEEFRPMIRPPPEDLSEHQRQMFCVFSRDGIKQLRHYLFELYAQRSEQVEEARQRRLIYLQGVAVPIDELASDDIDEAMWLRDHDSQVNRNRSINLQEHANRQQPRTNSDMLPVRDGLVEVDPRDPRQLEAHAQDQLFNEIMAFAEHHPPHFYRPVVTPPDRSRHEETPDAESESQGESQGESQSEGASQMTSIAQLQLQRFIRTVRIHAAPTGPLEGTELPPQ